MAAPQRSRTYSSLDEYVPLSDVPSLLPQLRGRSLHPATIIRWATAGCSGVRLRTVCLGRIRCTTRAWLTEFAEEVDASRMHRQQERRGRGG
ncbi:MAG: DUF1580 domain-containing protein [Planctomycetes bacterium]|nr:DUF1580 domain-containing protein [Planctomycetota bacterium]